MRRPAMALPTRCTSLGPIWRSTAAASDSPRLSRKIAALSSLFNFCVRFSSLIGIDPLFDYLGHPARIFSQQTLDGIQLLLITGTRWRQQYRTAGRRRQADCIVAQLGAEHGIVVQRRITLTFSTRPAAASAADALEHRAQHAKYQHQHEQDTQHLLGNIPEPGLGPERYCGNLQHLTGHRYKGGVDHADTVAPLLVI